MSVNKSRLLLLVALLFAGPVQAGAICVVALWKGSVLDHEFLSGLEHPFQLQEKGEALLAEKGYDNYDRGLDIRHARGQTYLDHGYALIIESNYIPANRKIDKQRRSIGCGFSKKSYDDALWDALRDMQTHDWSWKPDRDGYKVIEKIRF
jgi:hypothetical protein